MPFKYRLRQPPSRHGAVLVLAALLLVAMFGMSAIVIDLGYMSLTATQLQNAADGAALAGIRMIADGNAAMVAEAQETAIANSAGGSSVNLPASQVVLGRFDVGTRTFTPGAGNVNAMKVTAGLQEQPYFLASIFGRKNYNQTRSAVAMINPRDICFVVDLSGSMNDDTEPCWATHAINDRFGPAGYPSMGDGLCQKIYDDLNYGAFPGATEWVGQPLGISWGDGYAYAIMTMDDGPLTDAAIPDEYRIENTDDEATRKEKCYRWIIEFQLKRLMPEARPLPAAADTPNYPKWEKYLDYVLGSAYVGSWEDPPVDPGGGDDPGDGGDPGGGDPGGGDPGGGDPGGGDPPPTPPSGMLSPERWFEYAQSRSRSSRLPRDLGQLAGFGNGAAATLLLPGLWGPTTPGIPRNGSTEPLWLPPDQDNDRIYCFNNPNSSLHPGVDGGMGWWYSNQLGYRTYLQYLMDWGRDRSSWYENDVNVTVPGVKKSEVSVENPHCRYHNEMTVAGEFSFPASEQPMHAVRRALIAAIKEVEDRNTGLSLSSSDRVSIVTFDAVSADHQPEVRFALSNNYRSAMTSCTTLQSLSDIGNSTATEAGLALAREHLKNVEEGGAGRNFAQKVIILCTDGVPNVWSTNPDDIGGYISANPSSDYYASGYPWYNSVLMQTAKATNEKTKVFGVGMGLGADLNFMDRLARLADTDKGGLSPRGTGNPADYEERLSEILKEIINNRSGRLVK
jgi:Flp pilus assembly protein TadG